MKNALQIYGEFRCFEKCLPDILHYIDYSNNDFDVFILTQKNSKTYSIENLNKIENLLGKDNIKDMKYIEGYPKEILDKEDTLVKEYMNLLYKFAKNFKNLSANGFVTRLWYRRYLNNQMRIEYENKNNIKYDYVVRTRFDIGFNSDIKYKIDYSNAPFFYYDLLSIASPEIINIESQLGLEFPITPKYMYNQHLELDYNKPYMKELINKGCNHPKWIFMSENNLYLYLIINVINNLDIKNTNANKSHQLLIKR